MIIIVLFLAEPRTPEPPSALATRVLRAWDNPSPPPSPHSSPRGLRNEEKHALIADDDATPSDGSDDDDDDDDPSAVQDTANVGCLVADTSVQPTPSRESGPPVEGQTDDVDLINFDSFTSSPSIHKPAVNLMPATPPHNLLGALFTVDDLLAPSPLRPLTQTTNSTAAGPLVDLLGVDLQPSGPEDSASVDEEAQVLIVLAEEPKRGSTPSALPSTESSVELHEPLAPDPLPETELSTPLRRSTRPRRSVSPYFYPLTGSPSKLPDPSLQSPSRPTVEVGPARRRRMKTQEEFGVLEPVEEKDQIYGVIPTSPNKLMSGDAIQDDIVRARAPSTITAIPLTKERARSRDPETQQRLGSLSPTSTNLLMQLLPSEEGKDTSSGDSILESTVHGDDATKAEGIIVSPIEGAARTEGSFPFVANGIPARPSTPPRNSTSSQPSRDITRTPARRIPISEAINQGSLSPAKVPALQTMSTTNPSGDPLGFLGGPVFKPRGPAETMRSPAKRVPIAQAMSSLHPPTKLSTRPASPVKSTHVRSSSEDPIQPIIPKFQRSMSAEPVRPSQSSLKVGEIFRKPAFTQSIPVRASQTAGESSHSVPSLNIPPSIQEIDEAGPQEQVSRSKLTNSLRPPTGKVESRIPRPGIKPYVRPSATSSINKIPRPVPSLPKKTHTSVPASTDVSTRFI